MTFIDKLRQIFGFAPKHRYYMGEVNIFFYTDANFHGEHGKIVVSRLRDGLYEVPVTFCFQGMMTPPKMTDQVINFIFAEARHQGFIPHHIEQYGNNSNPNNPGKPVMVQYEEPDHSMAAGIQHLPK